MAAIPTPTIPIANLHPGLSADTTSVTGVVTLIWPYASSTRSASLLLVESDFRLRKHRGQVRIHFDGSSAKAVAKAGVSSGDKLLLSLLGTTWVKDASTASTPGKSIEWELRFGEHLVLQISRKAQEPVLLQIDHPPPSPEPTSRSSTPQQSPIPISSIATSTLKSSLDENTWESPAFLKRTRFTGAIYNVFDEEMDEFPDNDRRKRSKLGRGSSEWRFADRTPSPEKLDKVDAFESSSPLRQHGVAEMQPILIVDAAGALGGSELRKEIESREQQKHEENEQVDKEHADVAPPSPPSTTAYSESAIPEEYQVETLSSQLESSLAGKSESEEESDSDLDSSSGVNDSDGAAFSGSPSDLGFDGSSFSKAAKPSEEPQSRKKETESETSINDTKSDQWQEYVTSQPPRDDVDQQSYKEDEASLTVQESRHEFHLPEDELSSQSESSADYEQAVREQWNDQQGDQAMTDTGKVSIDLGRPPVRDVPADVTFGQVPSQYVYRDVSLADTGNESWQTDLRGREIEESIEDEQEHMETPSYSDTPNEETPLKTLDGAPGKRIYGHVVPRSFDDRVEIIDLESNDEETEQVEDPGQYQSDRLSESSYGDLEEAETKSVSSRQSTESTSDEVQALGPESQLSDKLGDELIDEKSLQRDPNETGHSLLEISVSSEPEGEPPASDGVHDASPPSLDEETNPRLQLEGKAERTELLDQSKIQEFKSDQELPVVKKQEYRSQSPPMEVAQELQPKAEMGQTVREPSAELPSTIPDSADVQERFVKSQLMTPDMTQQTSFASQRSFTSQQTNSNDETLPTPQLTQGTSSGIIIPSLQQELVPLESALSTAKQDSKSHRKDPRQSSPALRQAPTLIEKLKAMRRLSSQRAQKIGDVSAVSPWFAPLRSNKAVPDSEAESDIESPSEGNKDSGKTENAALVHTPEKQSSLAKSFIRSPPQRDEAASMASSPGYHPPSQAPPPGFRTTLSYYVPLATLQSHFTLSVDVLAVALATTKVTRAASGPRDYNHTIYITDPSSCSSRLPLTTVQIFRSHNKCFPVVEKGDAILLREFKIQSFQRQLALLSTQSSAWAVFRQDAAVQIRGPPVEYGAEERGFARGLWRWWDGLSQETKQKLDQAIPEEKEKKTRVQSKSNAFRKRHKRHSDGIPKKEVIEGLGLDLPGSQGKNRNKAVKEWSPTPDEALESTEPPMRVLRPRGAKGLLGKSESPSKAINRRSGTVFTGGLGEPESE